MIQSDGNTKKTVVATNSLVKGGSAAAKPLPIPLNGPFFLPMAEKMGHLGDVGSNLIDYVDRAILRWHQSD